MLFTSVRAHAFLLLGASVFLAASLCWTGVTFRLSAPVCARVRVLVGALDGRVSVPWLWFRISLSMSVGVYVRLSVRVSLATRLCFRMRGSARVLPFCPETSGHADAQGGQVAATEEPKAPN